MERRRFFSIAAGAGLGVLLPLAVYRYMMAGANVGYASALFASQYPKARILAVEPDPGNFRLCRENLHPYGDRVRTLLGAVWARRSRLALARGQSGDGRDWAVQVQETSNECDARVEAWDVPALLELAGEAAHAATPYVEKAGDSLEESAKSLGRRARKAANKAEANAAKLTIGHNIPTPVMSCVCSA